jgi:MFS family permease
MRTPAAMPDVPRNLRRARIAVSALFLTNGAIFANLLPRYPAIKESLGLTNTEFGAAVASFPLGALVAGLAAAALIRRFRSSRVAVFGTILTSVGVLFAGLAPAWLLLAAALFAAGAMDAITDVAQNSHGLRVQRAYRRSILNSFHAVWSIGAVIGGLMGGAAAGLGVPLGVHLGASAVIFCTVSLICYRLMLPGAEPAEALTPHLSEPTRARSVNRARMGIYAVLVALICIAAGGAVVEDAGSSWSAIYLSGSLAAGASVAALGFVALVGAQFVGRMLGDRLVDRFGQRAVARAGATIVVVGMGAALAFPSIIGTIAGFAAVGLGVATLVPAAMGAADALPGLRRGTGLTLVSWLMRLGFLAAPPIVGLIADATSLRVALLIVPLVGLAVVALAGVLGKRQSMVPV